MIRAGWPPRPAPCRAAEATGGELAKLAFGALGVVYGDIGTSPLYALRDCVTGAHGVPPTPENVLGLLSLMFWAFVLVVVVKYLVFVLAADNHGEGGVLALMSLVMAGRRDTGAGPGRRSRILLVSAGILGAALLYGDGMITPAITVLSAVEGLRGGPGSPLEPWIVPIACAVIVGLFAAQRRGTAGLGAVFGPAMLLWFVCIGAVGVPWILRSPEVLEAVLPTHAVGFFSRHGLHGFLVLGTVVLCVTGGEALYADMGHFGRRAIRLAWYAVAFPGLLLNYFGQGALLLDRPEQAGRPFFALVEGPLHYPMVALATIAGVIASQALISGAFSLTRQAIQLGYLPRLTIVHTSPKAEGQIYVPEVNGLLMVACVALVLGFRRSEHLTAAYGIAVTGTMAITSVLFFVVLRERWGWGRAPALSVLALFLVTDLAFLGANLAKIAHGGWFPIAVAVGGFAVMMTWRRGRAILARNLHAQALPIEAFVADLAAAKPHRVPGTAVFMSSSRRGTPNVLLHHFKHNKVLHEQVVILTIVTDDLPVVPPARRVRFRAFGAGFWAVTAHYGFMESPDVGDVMRLCGRIGPSSGGHDVSYDVSYYVGRETLVKGVRPTMSAWRRRLFALLSRNARAATDFYRIPPNRVVELGTQVEL